MKKLVVKMMAVCAGALIVSCGSGKNMLSVSSLDGEWNITEAVSYTHLDVYKRQALMS